MPPVATSTTDHAGLVQSALAMSRGEPLHPSLCRKRAGAKQVSKRAKTKAPAVFSTCSSALVGRVSKHIGVTKSYIRSPDETGCMRCRWHLSAGTRPDHGDITRAMFDALRSQPLTMGMLESVLESVKGGCSTRVALGMIKKLSTTSTLLEDVQSNPSSELSGADTSSDSLACTD